MRKTEFTTPQMACSFCGKYKDEVQFLIAGPNWHFICNECVFTCVDILKEQGVYYLTDSSANSITNTKGANEKDDLEI